MKGSTLREQGLAVQPTDRPRVVKDGDRWLFECVGPVGTHISFGMFPTHAEALAAANAHALEHLGEDMGRWAEQLPPLTDDEVTE